MKTSLGKFYCIKSTCTYKRIFLDILLKISARNHWGTTQVLRHSVFGSPCNNTARCLLKHRHHVHYIPGQNKIFHIQTKPFCSSFRNHAELSLCYIRNSLECWEWQWTWINRACLEWTRRLYQASFISSSQHAHTNEMILTYFRSFRQEIFGPHPSISSECFRHTLQ